MTAPPWLWLIAGPNGSGKTSLARGPHLRLWAPGIPAVAQTPDEIALRLRAERPEATEAERVREAQIRSDRLLDEAIAAGRTAFVETVLSSGKFRDRVERALAGGYRFGLVYVSVLDGVLNLARVEQRVAAGGHDVPPELVLARRERSAAEFAWFAARAHRGLLVDNTGTDTAMDPAPVLVAEKREGDAGWVVHRPGLLPGLEARLPAMAEPR